MGPKRSTAAPTAAAPAPAPKKTKKTAAAAVEGDEFVARREGVKDFDKVIAQEIQRESEIQKSEELNEKYRLGGLDALCGLKAGKAFNWLYRLDTKASFDSEIYTNARDWWERADAIQQCNNTIGEKNLSDECYICGLKLNEDTGAKKTPECEHILPVFQGALFLNLYRSEYKTIMTKRKETLSLREKELYDTFMLEYKWAHRCCNQIKSNISFLTFDPKREEFKLDFTSSSVILKGIFEAKMSKKDGKGSETRAYCNAISKILKANYKNDVNKFIKERSDVIFHRNIKPICDRLHRQMGNKMARKGAFYMGLLANLITAADGSKIAAAQAAARGEELNRPPPMESVEKAQIYSDLTSKIAGVFDGPKWGIRGINKDEKNALLRGLISPTDQRSWLLDSKLSVDSNKIAKLMIESFVDGSILRTASSSSPITYRSLYRDLFCIFAYPSHFNGEILVHSDSGARQISHKDSAKFANYGMRAVLLSEISSRFSSLLLSYLDRADPLYLGLSAVHIKIKSLLKENILALKLSKNHTKVLCVVMRVCEFFNTAAKTEFENILTSESLYATVNAELPTVNENYLADENIIHGRVQYYTFYKDAKVVLDIEDDKIIEDNVDILEVSAVDALEGMFKSKEIFTSSIESESQAELASEFIKTEEDSRDVFIEQIESPIKAELLSLSRSRSKSRSESLSPATTAETTSTSSSAAQRVYTEQELLSKTHSELSKIAKSFGIRQTQTYKSLVKQIANPQRRKYTQRYLEEHTTLSLGGRKTRRNRK